MRGLNRLWQAAATVKSILTPGLLETAAQSGLRSLFVGFETLNPSNLRAQRKYQNLNRDYSAAIRRLHDLGVMVNASFVFGMDDDDDTVFDRTVEWAIRQGIETATFHILTPYPGTALHQRLSNEGRIAHANWDLYDTRHVVFQPARLSRKIWRRAIGALIASFTGGRSRARRPTPARSIACATSLTRAAGKSSSLYGIWSFALNACRTLCRCWRTFWPGLARGTRYGRMQSDGQPCLKRSPIVMQHLRRTIRLFLSSTQVQQVQHAELSS
jgi:radical SAM superfamily enzyme YgiQ (UPF0313 family)